MEGRFVVLSLGVLTSGMWRISLKRKMLMNIRVDRMQMGLVPMSYYAV